jgi:hypothetical protein
MKEIAKPRSVASVRKISEIVPMTARAKFSFGILLHNRNTKEDGLVTRVYQILGSGEPMYEVVVPGNPNTWAGGQCLSDWTESNLELSSNATLKASGKPPVL